MRLQPWGFCWSISKNRFNWYTELLESLRLSCDWQRHSTKPQFIDHTETSSLSTMYCVVFFLGVTLLLPNLLLGSSKDPWSELWSSSSGNNDDRIMVGGNEIVPESDLRNLDRRIWIITTACLPWLTGTSVNPLLRAAYLAKDRPKGRITLMVPWLEAADQEIAFPPGVRFQTPDEQRTFVKKWLIEDAHLPLGADRLEIVFYTARYGSKVSLKSVWV